MFGILKKIFGTAQSRLLKKDAKIVLTVNEIEKRLQLLSDVELKRKTDELKLRLSKGETLNDILPEAYAVVKNVCRRLCGTEVHVSGYNQKWDMIPYDVQILGAIAMHYGALAEMQTGEGKTLTASMPLYLNALSGKPVHLVTANDYLAERDCEWMGAIFRWLGLKVCSITNNTPHNLRKSYYASDIVYGTASEFGFDYLRDNAMAQSAEEQVQRGHFFAIIDEVDSILIDEARTPLIISGPSSESKQMYEELKEPVANLVRQQRDLCNRLANDAKKILEKLDLVEEKQEKKKLSKEEEKEEKESYRKLWLVSKGTPQNKVLKRFRENPDIRAAVEALDTYFHADPNKEERLEALAELFIIVDERANEYELTDLGIQSWGKSKAEVTESDFTMIDLGHEYAQIDTNPDLSEEEKLEKKVVLREEDGRRKERAHNLRQLFRAHLLMEKDIDYIVQQGKIVIIDENTGRPQPGRRFSDGLHQSIEAKEGVAIQGETQTYATITLQNYFRMYGKLSGMTGTAMTEAQEFKEIYKIDVLAIPTYLPCQRADYDDEIYMSEREKYNAIVKDIKEIHEKGRPILIGTESVETSEKLSRILRQNRLEHTVLNAKQHDKEAEIIAEAGKKGAITVATNMAGRGTDIKLKEGVKEAGGLHVIGTTRQTRRVDRQLKGRSARLGDPGSAKFYVSFEDSLLRLFTSPRVTAFLQKFRPPEGEPIAAKVLNKSIETAQKRVEQRNYTMRKYTLEYDDVMNKQRSEIYAFRNEILHTQNPTLLAEEILESVCSSQAAHFLVDRATEEGWNPQGYCTWLQTHFPLKFDLSEFDSDYLSLNEIEKTASIKVVHAFQKKISHQIEMIKKTKHLIMPNSQFSPENVIQEVIRNILVRSIDRLWQEHLLHIDHLRTEVHLRSIGQKDPLLEFKHEAFHLFNSLSLKIKIEIAHALFKFEMVVQDQEKKKRETIEQKKKKPLKEHRTMPMIDLSLMDEEDPDNLLSTR
ncbi:MAG: preprotein translocase subunit SecA [Chlamydiae bacterium]|nr:preprotein translocase subunit SecA [Chlamydiota bacterium]